MLKSASVPPTYVTFSRTARRTRVATTTQTNPMIEDDVTQQTLKMLMAKVAAGIFMFYSLKLWDYS